MRVKTISFLLLMLLLSTLNPVSAVTQADDKGNQDDMGTGDDAGDKLEDATEITYGEAHGYLHYYDDPYDYYKTPVSEGWTIEVELTTKLNMEVGLGLYDHNQLGVDQASFKPGQGPASVSWTFTSSGYAYIAVHMSVRSVGTYTLSVFSDAPPAAPETPTAPAVPEEPLDFFESIASLPGYPPYSVMVGILAVAIVLAFKKNH